MQFLLSTKHQHQVPDQPLVVPERHDILCGSGHAIFSHPGNMRFRSIVENKAQQYDNAVTRSDRIRITKGILFELRSTGARVLKKHPIYPLWSPVVGAKRNKVLRDKTTHYLRVFLTFRGRYVGAAALLPPPQQPAPRLQEEHQEENRKLSTRCS